jgi:hypothetical protein
MYRKLMTRAESDKLKRMVKMNAHMGIRMGELYPKVESIEIHCELTHRSFCGAPHEKRTWTVTPQDEVYFMIDCLNNECTSAGFDLRDIVSSAIQSHQTEVSGEMRCEGREAPDHPEQSCSGVLKYTIKVLYKQ